MKSVGKLCGLGCVVPNASDIWEIIRFANIELNSHYFYIFDQSMYGSGYTGMIPEKVTPSFFHQINKDMVYVDRLVMHLYPKTTEPKEIVTYEEYVSSKCEMIILVYDTCHVEIYCKNPVWLRMIMRIVEALCCASIEEKYEGSDPRYRMYV